MITLSELSLNNFFSHVNTHIPLKEYEGLVLIEGQNHDGHYSSNGSGKSTILEGIVYALTGDTLRGVSVNDVINRNYKKNTSVTLKFDMNNEEYEVGRYRKHDIRGDSITLRRGDTDISKRVNKDTQKALDDAINISYKILVSTMLLGEGLSSRFTQLSDPEKKALIESTLSMDCDIAKSRENANSKLKELRLDLAKVEGEISVLSDLMDTDTTLYEDSIKDNESLIIIYEDTLKHLQELYESAAAEIDSISPKLSLINTTLNSILSLEKDRESKALEFHRVNKELQDLLASNSPICALCHQALQSAESKNAVVNQYRATLDSLYTEINNIDTELSKLPDEELLKKKAEDLNAEYNKKSQDYRDLLQDHSTYKLKIAEAQREIKNARQVLESAVDSNSKLETKIESQNSLKKEIEKYEYFYKLFSPTGIVVNILSDAISYINQRLTTYSEVLLEKDYRLEFLKGKISIVDSTGSSYQSLSNGEKRRLDIAIQFSLHDYVHMYCGNSVDTMFIDEILDTLDDIGIENIITVLRLKLEYCKLSRIFVISHNSELKSFFDKVITVVKDENGDSHLN